MLKAIRDYLDLHLSVAKLHRLEKRLKREQSSILDVPFVFSGYGLFQSIRPKQVVSEIKELYDIVLEQRVSCACEIGTFRGGTFYLWCKAALDNATLISIDLPSDDSNQFFSAQRRKFYKHFASSPQQNIYFLAADSHQNSTREHLHKILGGQKIDFLFIDGDHSYEGVVQDFELYLPLVRSGGVIAFHDILPRPEFPSIEVYRLWEALKIKYKYKEIVAKEGEYANLTGIGIIWID